MPHRPPRAGDLLHVRLNGDHKNAVIEQVTDDGRTLTLSGEWAGIALHVDVRRVGDTQLAGTPGTES